MQATEAKRVKIKFVSGNRHEEVLVLPGTTVSEILTELGLDNNFQLSRGTPDSVFGLDEVIFPQLQDGDLLFVGSRADAGTF